MVPGGSWLVLSFSCPSLRSVIVENSSGQKSSCTSTSELHKPMKKRKHREYQSPSEEELEADAMVGRGQCQGRERLQAVSQFPLSYPSVQVMGLGQRRLTHLLGSHPESGPVPGWRRVNKHSPASLELPSQSSIGAKTHSHGPAPKTAVWSDGELCHGNPGTRPGGRQNEHRAGVCILFPHLGMKTIVVRLCRGHGRWGGGWLLM